MTNSLLIASRLLSANEELNSHLHELDALDDKYLKIKRYIDLLYKADNMGWDDWSWDKAMERGILCKRDFDIFEELAERTWEEAGKMYKAWKRRNLNRAPRELELDEDEILRHSGMVNMSPPGIVLNCSRIAGEFGDNKTKEALDAIYHRMLGSKQWEEYKRRKE